MKATLAKYDDANLITSRLQILGIAVNLFGRYVGLSSSEICSLLNGTKRLNKTRLDQFKQMADDLEMVARAFSPAPVDFKNIDAVRNLISGFIDGSLLVGVSRWGCLTLSGAGLPDSNSW
jgi:hypothetical protein